MWYKCNIVLAVTSATCLPAVPSLSAASNTDCSSFTANWSASTGATSYYLEVSTSKSSGSFEERIALLHAEITGIGMLAGYLQAPRTALAQAIVMAIVAILPEHI